MDFLSAFDAYPKQGMIVGKLLVGYGELEFGVLNLLAECVPDDTIAIQLMFRIRSETARLDIADALLRHYFENCKLLDEYEEAWLALQNCKAIRNRYAHSHWTYSKNGLFFTDLEKPAADRTGEEDLTIRHTTEPILIKQLEYFEYCLNLLEYLEAEALKQRGKKTENEFSRPIKLQKPLLYTPPQIAPRLD